MEKISRTQAQKTRPSDLFNVVIIHYTTIKTSPWQWYVVTVSMEKGHFRKHFVNKKHFKNVAELNSNIGRIGNVRKCLSKQLIVV